MTESPDTTPSPAGAGSPPAAAAGKPQVGKLLGLAVLVGVGAAVLATLFTALVHQLEHLVWTTLPDAFGWSEPASWWIVAMLLVGAVLTWAACKLPGGGGHHPLKGLSFDIGPATVGSAVLAALASLVFGAVVGPEAPLMAIGTATALAIARKADPTRQQILMMAGAMAAMGTIFGNPLVTAILLLEATALIGGGSPQATMTKLLPALLALGCGYLIQVGAGSFSGVGQSVLAVPGLPAYPDVQWLDLVVSIPLAILVALVCVAAIRIATGYSVFADRHPLPGIIIAASLIAILAIGVRAITGLPSDTVLFSGQAAIPEALTITGASTMALLLVVKGVAYALSIGGGFRGGMIFPGVYIGVVGAVMFADLMPKTNVAALCAAGIAAASAAIMRLPFTSTLLAVLLCAEAGLAVTTSAIVAAIIGLIVRLAIDAKTGSGSPMVPAGSTRTAPQPATA